MEGAEVGAAARRRTFVIGFLAIAAIWIVTRPYQGIVDDSQFYAVQALSRLWPDRYLSDLYFQFGTQDDFTLFSPLYAPFIRVFGIASGTVVLLLLSQLVWLAGLGYLAYAITRDLRMSVLAMAVATALPISTGFVGNGEAFLTPRLVAEGLTLAAMGLTLHGRTARAGLCLAFAFLLHPLMAIAGFATLVCFAIASWRVALLAASLAALALALLAIAPVPPFERFLQRMDGPWIAVMQEREYWFFLRNWSVQDWLRLLTVAAIALTGALTLERQARKLIIVALTVAAAGLAATFLGGDILHNVLILDLQPWRAVWLITGLAQLSIAPAIARLWPELPPSGRVLSLFTVCLLILCGYISPVCYAALPVALATLMIAAWIRLAGQPLPRAVSFFVYATTALSGAWVAQVVPMYLMHRQAIPGELAMNARGFLIGIAVLAILVPMLFRRASPRLGSAGFAIGTSAIAAFLALGALHWDQRSPWTRYVSEAEAPPPDLAALIDDSAGIYWEGDMRVPWLVLKRANYFSCNQGAQSQFSRGAALAYLYRKESFAGLDPIDFGLDKACPSVRSGERDRLPGRDDLKIVCAREPSLDVLVLTKNVTGASPRVWHAPVAFIWPRIRNRRVEILSTDRLFVYYCSDYRKPTG